jgi:MoaA/NifB/PqqE/SkfB family radical SAM enzyme
VNSLELAAHWLRGRATLPRYLILGMTNLCNSKCVTCFYWDHLNVNRHLELSLEEYERALADLGSLYSVVLTGGEPTLNRDLPEITRILYRRHDASNVTMPTNSLIPEQVEEIVTRALESRRDEKQTFTVGLSLDHLGERHDRIRGAPGNFPKVIETYRRLEAVKRRVRGFTLNVQTVLASFNREDLPEITAWVSRSFPEIDFHSFELLRPPFPDPSIRPLTAPEYAEALAFLEPYWRSFDRYRPILRNLKIAARGAELATLEEERMVYKCYAGTISGVLNPEGTVSLCEVQWEIGNIRDFGYSFRRAWFSERANELRQRVARRECWCTHSCFMTSSLPFSVKGAAHLAKTALLPAAPRSGSPTMA